MILNVKTPLYAAPRPAPHTLHIPGDDHTPVQNNTTYHQSDANPSGRIRQG